MRLMPLAATILLLVTTASLPAHAKKQKSADTQKTAATSHPKDVANSLDELLSSPVPKKSEPTVPDIAKPRPEVVDKLHGAVEHSADGATGGSLSGKADDANPGGLRAGVSDGEGKPQPLQPKLAPDSTTVLKGSAAISGGKLGVREDPDAQDRELMVEWDRWRNKFLRAVQLQVQAGVNQPDEWEETPQRSRVVYDPYSGRAIVQPRFPMGTEAWFSCEITADRRVKNLKIIRESGHSDYDKAILEGVRALEGTSMLQFPPASKRPIVTQSAGIRTSETSDYQYHHFGDVERYRQR